jgi:DNA gyrase subunit A
VDDTDEVLLISTGGQVIRSKVNAIRDTHRVAQGVRLMRINDDIRIAAVAVVVKEEEEGEGDGSTKE